MHAMFPDMRGKLHFKSLEHTVSMFQDDQDELISISFISNPSYIFAAPFVDSMFASPFKPTSDTFLYE